MAGKKPAKVNSSNKKEVVILPGKAVYYMGLMTEGFTCPVCKRNLIKGIIYEHEGSSYCTRSCIPKQEKVDAAWVY